MRRNCENLLVLGGQDQARRWNKPVPLVDIVRASLSEVEQYERITLRIQDDVAVAGRVVNDLVHLVAELVENSTSFSPEHTKVAVSGHLLSGGGAMLQISDNGVGMAPEQLEESNWRLANPPTIDVSVSRRMGLFVVGRLAQRHGIRVELRAALSGGLTAFVILPSTAIMQDAERADRAAASRLAGRRRGGVPRRSPRRPSRPPLARPSAARGELSRRGGAGQLPPPVPETPARAEAVSRPASRCALAVSELPAQAEARGTAPPGRGSAPTAPARSTPQRPSNPPPPPRPAARPAARGRPSVRDGRVTRTADVPLSSRQCSRNGSNGARRDL